MPALQLWTRSECHGVRLSLRALGLRVGGDCEREAGCGQQERPRRAAFRRHDYPNRRLSLLWNGRINPVIPLDRTENSRLGGTEKCSLLSARECEDLP